MNDSTKTIKKYRERWLRLLQSPLSYAKSQFLVQKSVVCVAAWLASLGWKIVVIALISVVMVIIVAVIMHTNSRSSSSSSRKEYY